MRLSQLASLLSSSLLALGLLSGCAFHSTANSWNERVGPDGEPVYVKSTSSIGINLAILLRVLGSTDIDTIVDEMTEDIASEDGDYVRIIQSSSENYWYGFPPFTWVVTPVITTVAAEYRPSEAVRAEDLAEEAEDD